MGKKNKTHKGARKRFKITSKGKVKYKKSFTGHLLGKKSGKRLRKLRRPATLSKSEAKRVKKLLKGH